MQIRVQILMTNKATFLRNPFIITHYTLGKKILWPIRLLTFFQKSVYSKSSEYTQKKNTPHSFKLMSLGITIMNFIPSALESIQISNPQRGVILPLHVFVWRHFWLPQQGWRLLLASCEWRPGTLNILQTKNDLPPNINSAEVEKSCFTF